MAVFKFSNVGGFGTYQRYNDFLAGNPVVQLDKGSMFPLGVITLASASASVTFSSIPQTYTHLQVRALFTNSTAQLNDTLWRINDDTTSGNYYNYHQIRGDGASATASQSNALGAYVAPMPYGNSTSFFSVGIVDILDYKNTNKNKTFRSLTGHDLNGSGNVFFRSALWINTSAINKIEISTTTNTFATNSSFALYGINA